MTTTDQEPTEEEGGQPADLERRGRYRVPRKRPLLAPDLEIGETLHGTKPGSLRVRRKPSKERLFRQLGEAEYRAEAAAIRPRTASERVWRGIKRVVVGAPLATGQLVEERLSKLKALAIFSSDMLSSSAYATEEILLVLLLAATTYFRYATPIALAITILVVIVAASYRQVIRGYPGGGGSYAVAKENLGMWPGLVAGGSLIADYVLTVAVSTAAGVAAITSAIPELHDFRIELAVGFVAVLTLGNLRGIRESGTLFAIPAYVFIVSITALIVTGAVRMALGHDLDAGTPPDAIEAGGQSLTIFLLLRAFSSGSAALTGIEAVSNGVPSFKPPESRNAATVLVWMAAILAFFFLGITILAHEVGVAPSETKTVVAQVADAVFAGTPLFYVVQVSTMLILVLAANTSFAGLPSLGSVMARDGFLPRQFAFRGDRLAFSNGIIVLGLASMGLLAVFRAETHALIPLYAVGVFTGFTLSQLGMVVHWHRDGSAGARQRQAINAVGAAATGLVTGIIAATKFIDGAWITLGAIALLVFFFTRIAHHYRRVHEQLEVAEGAPPPPVEPAVDGHRRHAVLVPIDDLNRAVLRTLDYARNLSENVTALHVTDDPKEADELRERWEQVVPDVPLVTIESPYRSLIAPVFAYIDALDRATPGVGVTVVLPEFVPAHFWEGLLHNQSAIRLKRALLHRPNTVVIDVPYHLRP